MVETTEPAPPGFHVYYSLSDELWRIEKAGVLVYAAPHPGALLDFLEARGLVVRRVEVGEVSKLEVEKRTA